MVSLKKQPTLIHLLIPFIGMFLFIGFYILSAFLYPGGSYKEPNSTVFSFTNNYLCDLLDTYAINGELNIASTMARMAFGILCFTMIYIWIQIPRLFAKKHINHLIIKILGVLSMIIAMFLAAGIHDTIVYIAGVFGLLALLLTFVELYKQGFFYFLGLGLCCFVLVSLNYIMYTTGYAIDALPLIQKITFIACISWFLMLMLVSYSLHKE